MRQQLACFLLATAAITSAGCFDVFTDPLLFRQTGQDGPGSGTGGTAGGGGTGGAPECVPSETNKDIAEGCGAFVSPTGNDDTGKGTKSAPFLTIAHAASVKPRVYACANPDKPFDEAVVPAADVTIHGGLDCAKDWQYDPTKKSAWTAPADTVPLSVTSAAKVEVYDFTITARNAEMAGVSSIAVFVAGGQAELTLERTDLTAGEGAAGEPGTTPDMIGPNNEGAAGGKGEDGKGGDGTTPACVDTGYLGGAAGQNTCGVTDSAGGAGGQGLNGNTGGTGQDGNPLSATDGKGGKGDDGTGCKAGTEGAHGINGPAGAGATGLGTLTEAGYSGTFGEDGKGPGTHGQGGGGGGGAKKCANNNAGPGGGGGGAGGCGGLRGTGGKAGGASIGLATVGAKSVKLSFVTVNTAKGGDGGKGGNGQPGGAGGLSGAPGAAGACQGGPGGGGGHGGSGGGGLGGPSWGLAIKGTAPIQTNVKITVGAAGNGGLGGDDDMNASGQSGTSCLSRNLDTMKCQN